MTTLLDAPVTTRRERAMLERKMAATTEPETTTATDLPMVEQASTVVVTDGTDLEQSKELVTDTSAEAAADPSMPESVVEPEPVVSVEAVTVPEPDDDDVFPMDKPRTRSLPMLGFKPVRKDMSDDDEVPYAAPMSTAPYFADDDDESGIENRSAFSKVMTDAEQEAFLLELDTKEAIAKPIREAEEKARKAKAEKDEAKRLARIEKRGSRRMLGNIMMAAGTFATIYGVVVTFVPGF